MSGFVAMLKQMKAEGLDFDAAIRILEAGEPSVPSALEKRRAYDRQRKQEKRAEERESTGHSTGLPPDPAPNERDNLTPTRKIPPKPIGLDPKPKKHRLPADWEPTPFKAGSMAALTVIRWEPGRLERELSKFRDHHTAAGSRFECWQSAWSKWVNNSEDFQRGRNGGQQQSPGIGRTEAAAIAAYDSITARH